MHLTSSGSDNKLIVVVSTTAKMRVQRIVCSNRGRIKCTEKAEQAQHSWHVMCVPGECPAAGLISHPAISLTTLCIVTNYALTSDRVDRYCELPDFMDALL